MNGYQKLKDQYEQMKRSRDYECHRATVYWLAFMSHIDEKSDQMKKIMKTAESLFKNYPGEDHQWDPLLKVYEER